MRMPQAHEVVRHVSPPYGRRDSERLDELGGGRSLAICVAALGVALFVGLVIGAVVSLPMLVLGHAGLAVALLVLMIAVVFNQIQHRV
jgi:hypothetical protein